MKDLQQTSSRAMLGAVCCWLGLRCSARRLWASQGGIASRAGSCRHLPQHPGVPGLHSEAQGAACCCLHRCQGLGSRMRQAGAPHHVPHGCHLTQPRRPATATAASGRGNTPFYQVRLGECHGAFGVIGPLDDCGHPWGPMQARGPLLGPASVCVWLRARGALPRAGGQWSPSGLVIQGRFD